MKNSQLYVVGAFMCFIFTLLVKTMNANATVLETATFLSQLF